MTSKEEGNLYYTVKSLPAWQNNDNLLCEYTDIKIIHPGSYILMLDYKVFRINYYSIDFRNLVREFAESMGAKVLKTSGNILVFKDGNEISTDDYFLPIELFHGILYKSKIFLLDNMTYEYCIKNNDLIKKTHN